MDECKPLIDGGASDTPAKLVVEDCEILNSAATFLGGAIVQLGTSHLEVTRTLIHTTTAWMGTYGAAVGPAPNISKYP